MKVTKTKDKKYPLLVTLSNGRKIKVARQGKFSTYWLRKHGCPFVSQFEIYQWLGMDVSKKYPLHLWKWAKAHLKKYIRATLTIKGLLAELNHFIKGRAKAKYYSPNAITADRITKFLKAGCMIVITRGKYGIHYYTLIMDGGKIYSLRFRGCTVKKRSAKFIVNTRSKNKRYGGMIVITKNKPKAPKKPATKKPATKKPAKKKVTTTKYRTNYTMNVRRKATTSSDIVGSVAKGKTIGISKVSGNWGYCPGKKGWICIKTSGGKKYLTKVK